MAIARMKTFNQRELLHLLYTCSHLLGEAYQNTLFKEFDDASFEASIACEQLRCQLEQEHAEFKLH